MRAQQFTNNVPRFRGPSIPVAPPTEYNGSYPEDQGRNDDWAGIQPQV